MAECVPLHAVVVPIYQLGGAALFAEAEHRLETLRHQPALLVLVDNNEEPDARLLALTGEDCQLIHNGNRGGLAGGLNAGIRRAITAGARWISLLDQDSWIEPGGLALLREAWEQLPGRLLVVGPAIWDSANGRRHGAGSLRPGPVAGGPWRSTRLLISSGTTFRSCDFPRLGWFNEQLFIDFLDHAWCFRARSRGFLLVQDERASLRQCFGTPHPSGLCRRLGMQLYSPRRHYFGLRNLRWLCRQRQVPIDLKVKEVVKMAFKPLLWLLFEPQRRANAAAIVAGLRDPLPTDPT